MANVDVVHGDLLEQNVDVIVNAWNRNIILGGCYYLRVFQEPLSVLAATLRSEKLLNMAPFHLAERC